jgi:hypothetical protein
MSLPTHRLPLLLVVVAVASLAAVAGPDRAMAAARPDLLATRTARPTWSDLAIQADVQRWFLLGPWSPGIPGPAVEELALTIPIFTPARLTGTPVPPGSDDLCLAQLAAEGVRFDAVPGPDGIGTPVRLDGDQVGGIVLRYYFSGPPPRIMDCRLALGLARAAPVLRNNGVTEIIYSGHWRPSFRPLRAGEYNFHHQGLAIDVHGFKVGARTLWIEHDYETGLGFADRESCLGHPLTPKGLLLRKIACDLDESDVFEAILTPDYDEQHWNHFHLSVFHPAQRSGVRPQSTALLEVPLSDLTDWAIRRPIYQRPELRHWEAVGVRPWPEALVPARERLGIAAPEASLPFDLSLVPAPRNDLGGLISTLWDRVEPDVWELLRNVLPE